MRLYLSPNENTFKKYTKNQPTFNSTQKTPIISTIFSFLLQATQFLLLCLILMYWIIFIYLLCINETRSIQSMECKQYYLDLIFEYYCQKDQKNNIAFFEIYMPAHEFFPIFLTICTCIIEYLIQSITIKVQEYIYFSNLEHISSRFENYLAS